MAEELRVQVAREHYDFRSYAAKPRFCSYWHQVDEVLAFRPETLLLIGGGDGLVAGILRQACPALSITTFDGESESTPLVKCFGHTWISLDNRSGHPVYLKDCEIRDGEQVTLSVWAVRGLSGLLFNMEPGYIRDYGRYVGRRSLSANIGEEQLRTIEAYIDREDGWTLGGNCSRWSLRLWNAVVEEDFALKTQTLVYTPERVEKALCEFDCVETDRDFSRAGNIFCFRDGVRTELALCS